MLGWFRAEAARASVVEFYERMVRALAARGFERANHQTPLEFAATADIPEVIKITRAYNRVRFGGKDLTATESSAIEEWLSELEGNKR